MNCPRIYSRSVARNKIFVICLGLAVPVIITLRPYWRNSSNSADEPPIDRSSDRIFPRISTPSAACHDPHLTLVICVTSSVGHRDRRDAIRDTWAQKIDLGAQSVSLVFLLGSTTDSQVQLAVDEEAESHGDILQEDFSDTYNNLTLKSIMALRWVVSDCGQAKYFMKTDDDIFLNTKLIVKFLADFGTQRWIAGCIKQYTAPKPIRPAGGGPTANLPFVGHPNFVAGAGYVISSDILEGIAQIALRIPLVPVEDAFVTAYCARHLGIVPMHYSRFSCGEILRRNCYMKTNFVGHHVTPGRQYEIWKDLQNDQIDCNKR